MATTTRQGHYFEDPPPARTIFSSTRRVWLWLIVRVWLGYNWIEATLSHKIGNPAWVQTGAAIKGFWQQAIASHRVRLVPGLSGMAAEHSCGGLDGEASRLRRVPDWDRADSRRVRRIAAFFGAFMNWNFMMAGTASTNPILFAVAVLLILGWKVAGYYGLDRYLLPVLGTPWRPGKVFLHDHQVAHA